MLPVLDLSQEFLFDRFAEARQITEVTVLCGDLEVVDTRDASFLEEHLQTPHPESLDLE